MLIVAKHLRTATNTIKTTALSWPAQRVHVGIRGLGFRGLGFRGLGA